MNTLRTLRQVLAIACITPLAAFGVAACGGNKGGGGGGGGGGGDINVALTSFPDYVDPQLSYTVEGWEVLWNVYTPLLTYKHAKGKEGTQVVPALAEKMPDISPDGKTYKLKLRPNMKYSDGTPIKASDFAYGIQRLFKANSGGSVFFDVIIGAKDYADGKAQTISGIKADDNTGDITIELTEANGTFENVLGLMFAAPVPPSTPLDKDATNTPPPSSGPFMISKVEAPRTMTLVRNPNFKTVKDAGAEEVADAGVDKITITENKNNSAQVTDIEQNKVDFMVDPPASDRLQEVKTRYGNRFRLENSINTYYFWMNTQKAPFNDIKVRQAINYAVDPEALNRIFGGRLHPTQQILPPGMPGYEEYKLFQGPDMNKAKALIAEAESGRPDHHGLDRRRAGPQADRRVLPRPAHPARLQRDAQGDCRRRLLDDDRQPVDARSRYGVRGLVPGLPASGRLLPSAAARRQHPADQRQQLLAREHPREQRQAG